MELTTKIVELRTLTASEGHMLTENRELDNAQRTVCSVVHLAINASPDDWKEITVEEAEAIEAAQREAAEEEA